MSNTPGTIYILKSGDHYKSIGIYGEDRRLLREINWQHKHDVRDSNKQIVDRIRKGDTHIHHWKGMRMANVRRLTPNEIKRFGTTIEKIGGARQMNEMKAIMDMRTAVTDIYFQAVDFVWRGVSYEFTGYWVLFSYNEGEDDKDIAFFDRATDFLEAKLFDGKTILEIEDDISEVDYHF